MTEYDMISIDPGKSWVYVALWNAGVLCKTLRWDPLDLTQYERAPRIVIEKPNINKNTPNWQSVLDVAWSGALVAGRCGGNVQHYEPSQWKGSVVKPIHHGRVWAAMTQAERFLFPAEVPDIIQRAKETYARTGQVRKYDHDWHNNLDAVGLGLFALGRLGRGGAPPRQRSY